MAVKSKKKTFDCIEFKRQIQEEVFREIEGKSHIEQIRYYKERAASGPLKEW
jgi:hypothetical protein